MSGTGSSITATRPTNIAAGDLIVVVVQARDGGTIAPVSTGFTLVRHQSGTVANDQSITAVWVKTATASEPASYSFTRTAGNARDWRAVAGRVTGHDPVTPIGSSSGVSAVATSSITIPSITTSEANALLMSVLTVARETNASNIVHPSGMTAAWTTTGGTNLPASAGSLEVRATAGSTGTRQYSWTGSDGSTAVMFEIVPKAEVEAPMLHPDDGGVTQVAFSNIKQNSAQPTFRVSATHSRGQAFNRFQLELNTTSAFGGTAHTQIFPGTFVSGSEYNLTGNGLSPSLPATDGATYYARVRGSDDAGLTWGPWSTAGPCCGVWSFTYKSAVEDPDWFQTADAQFNTGTLSATSTTGSGSVRIAEGPSELTWHAADRTVMSGSGSSITATRPTNIAAGDLIVVVVQARDGGTITPVSTGFTLVRHESGTVANDRSITAIWVKIATASEPASYSFTRTAGNARDWRVVAGRVTGHDPVAPVGASSGVSAVATNSITIPSITTSKANALLVSVLTVARETNASNIVHPPGMTAAWTITGGTNLPASAGSLEVRATAGSTGTRQYSWTGSDGSTAVMFEILPKDIILTQGTIASTGVDFSWVPGATGWGRVKVGATTTASGGGNSITVQVLNAAHAPISGKSCTIANGETSGSINLFDVAPTGDNATLYLRATLNDNGGGTPYLNEWTLAWQRPLLAAVHVKAQDYVSLVSTITFPEAEPGATVFAPYNDVDGSGSPQAFGAVGTPVVTLVNTGDVDYLLWYHITTFTWGVVDTEYYLVNPKGAACAGAEAVNNGVVFDANTPIDITLAQGVGSAMDLYLKVVLAGEVWGKTGTSTLTILAEVA
jgi:hypothetical protein